MPMARRASPARRKPTFGPCSTTFSRRSPRRPPGLQSGAGRCQRRRADPQPGGAGLTGKLPAQALRDHTVARMFILPGPPERSPVQATEVPECANPGSALPSARAPRGAAHVGVIEVLIEAGIEIDILCGTSMGALVGGVHASGQLARSRNGPSRLTDVWCIAGGCGCSSRVDWWTGSRSSTTGWAG